MDPHSGKDGGRDSEVGPESSVLDSPPEIPPEQTPTPNSGVSEMEVEVEHHQVDGDGSLNRWASRSNVSGVSHHEEMEWDDRDPNRIETVQTGGENDEWEVIDDPVAGNVVVRGETVVHSSKMAERPDLDSRQEKSLARRPRSFGVEPKRAIRTDAELNLGMAQGDTMNSVTALKVMEKINAVPYGRAVRALQLLGIDAGSGESPEQTPALSGNAMVRAVNLDHDLDDALMKDLSSIDHRYDNRTTFVDGHFQAAGVPPNALTFPKQNMSFSEGNSLHQAVNSERDRRIRTQVLRERFPATVYSEEQLDRIERLKQRRPHLFSEQPGEFSGDSAGNLPNRSTESQRVKRHVPTPKVSQSAPYQIVSEDELDFAQGNRRTLRERPGQVPQIQVVQHPAGMPAWARSRDLTYELEDSAVDNFPFDQPKPEVSKLLYNGNDYEYSPIQEDIGDLSREEIRMARVMEKMMSRSMTSYPMMAMPPVHFNSKSTKSAQKNKAIKDVFPKTDYTFSGAPKPGDISIVTLLNRLTYAQNQVMLSRGEFINQFKQYFSGAARQIVDGICETENLSVKELYRRVTEIWYRGESAEKANEKLNQPSLIAASNLSELAAEITRLAKISSYKYIEGPLRKAHFQAMATDALLRSIPDTIQPLIEQSMGRIRAFHYREPEFAQVLDLVMQNKQTVDRHIENTNVRGLGSRSRSSSFSRKVGKVEVDPDPTTLYAERYKDYGHVKMFRHSDSQPSDDKYREWPYEGMKGKKPINPAMLGGGYNPDNYPDPDAVGDINAAAKKVPLQNDQRRPNSQPNSRSSSPYPQPNNPTKPNTKFPNQKPDPNQTNRPKKLDDGPCLLCMSLRHASHNCPMFPPGTSAVRGTCGVCDIGAHHPEALCPVPLLQRIYDANQAKVEAMQAGSHGKKLLPELARKNM